jgi:hypothetical protein
VTSPEDTAPADDGPKLALRVWDLDREHLSLMSFNAAPPESAAWWIESAFSQPTGGWPKDRPLEAECKAGREHEPHKPDCRADCEEHDGGIPAPDCRCGIYCTRDLGVVSDYLRRANQPVLGLIEIGGRTIMAEPDRPGYARGRFARVAAILLIDKALTIDHTTLRNVADAYRVSALVPHSTSAEDYRDRIITATPVADAFEAWLRKETEGGSWPTT